LTGYHSLGRSSCQLVVNARGLDIESTVSIYLEKRVVRISSESAEGVTAEVASDGLKDT